MKTPWLVFHCLWCNPLVKYFLRKITYPVTLTPSHLWSLLFPLFPLCHVSCRPCWSERCWSMLRVQRCGFHMAWLWLEVYSSPSWFAHGLSRSCGLLITAQLHACGGQRSRLPLTKSYVCAALKTSAQGRWENVLASYPMLHNVCLWHILYTYIACIIMLFHLSTYCIAFLLSLKGAVCNFMLHAGWIAIKMEIIATTCVRRVYNTKVIEFQLRGLG